MSRWIPLAVTLMTASLFAAPLEERVHRSEQPEQIRRLDDRAGPAVVRQWKTTHQARHAATRGVRPHAVIFEGSTEAFVIPAAGSLAGGGGTFFRSDVTFMNHEPAPRDVLVIWLERGIDNSDSAPTFVITLPPGPFGTLTFRDFIGETLELSGLGSLLVFSLDDEGQIDFSANIDGFSRIWTPQPGVENGTVSQQFPAVDPINLLGEPEAYALGLRNDALFRMNVGVVNLEEFPVTFEVIVSNGTVSLSREITVPPFSLIHDPGPAEDLGDVFVVYRPLTDDLIFWTAYATSNDNVTGDGWVASSTYVAATFEQSRRR